MKCNIESKGRRVRQASGYFCSAVGVGLAAAGLATLGPRRALLVGGACLIALGAFQVYEGRKGWCVVRAMGVSTPV